MSHIIQMDMSAGVEQFIEVITPTITQRYGKSAVKLAAEVLIGFNQALAQSGAIVLVVAPDQVVPQEPVVEASDDMLLDPSDEPMMPAMNGPTPAASDPMPVMNATPATPAERAAAMNKDIADADARAQLRTVAEQQDAKPAAARKFTDFLRSSTKPRK